MKPIYLFYLSGMLLFLSSCSLYNETYFGNSYPATDVVETFYAAKDVSKPYKVIGHLSIPFGPMINNEESAKLKLINRAKKAGANALIFSGIESRTDAKGAENLSIKAEAILYTSK